MSSGVAHIMNNRTIDKDNINRENHEMNLPHRKTCWPKKMFENSKRDISKFSMCKSHPKIRLVTVYGLNATN